MSKRDNKNQPWLANYPALAEWVKEHGKLCMWQTRTDGKSIDTSQPNGSLVECWLSNTGAIFVLVLHSRQQGWEIYTSYDKPSIAETLDDAECRLGIIFRAKRERAAKLAEFADAEEAKRRAAARGDADDAEYDAATRRSE